MSPFVSKRVLSILAVLVTVILGVVTRGISGVGDALGGVLYTVMIALLVLVLRPTTAARVAGLCGFLFSVAIELLQLTEIPRRIAAYVPAARWVLGSTFHAPDLGWYAVGGVAAAGVCWAIGKSAQHTLNTPTPRSASTPPHTPSPPNTPTPRRPTNSRQREK